MRPGQVLEEPVRPAHAVIVNGRGHLGALLHAELDRESICLLRNVVVSVADQRAGDASAAEFPVAAVDVDPLTPGRRIS